MAVSTGLVRAMDSLGRPPLGTATATDGDDQGVVFQIASGGRQDRRPDPVRLVGLADHAEILKDAQAPQRGRQAHATGS